MDLGATNRLELVLNLWSVKFNIILMALFFSLSIWIDLTFPILLICISNSFLKIYLPLVYLHFCVVAHVRIVVGTSDNFLNL